jgi:hypothetical protein
MIKINLFNQADFDRLLLSRAVNEYLSSREHKSFSERHPELGKMIKCAICGLRHRSARVCTPVYATHATKTVQAEDGSVVPMPMLASQHTRKGVLGANAFRGRILKHRNAWGLQVLDRAQQIYRREMAFYPNVRTDIADQTKAEKKEAQDFMDKIGKQSLSRALNEKRAARAARRRKFFLITRESRRVNRAA